MGMKKIHRYVAGNFVSVLIYSTVFFVFLFVLSDFFGRLSRFLKYSVPFKDIALYYLYYTPFILYYFTPFIFALSALITLGVMSLRNEIIVMRASGINIFRISVPIFVLAVLTALLMFFANEYVIGSSLDRAYFIKVFRFSSTNRSAVWLKKENMFIRAGTVNLSRAIARDVRIYVLDDNSIKRVIYAKRMLLGRRVKLEGVRIVDIMMGSRPKIETRRSMQLDFGIEVSELVKSPSKSSYSFSELLHLLKKDNKNRNYYLSLLVSRILYPLSVPVLLVLSFVFVLRITPRKSDFIRNVFFGSVMFLAYIVFFEMLVSMGKISMVQPVVAMVLFVLLWIVFSVYNLLKLGV